MNVTTKEAIQLIADGLGLKPMADSTFSRYYDSGLVTGRLPSIKGSKDVLFYQKSEIILSIERIRDHNSGQKASTEIANARKRFYLSDCKESENFAGAMNLFNKCMR